MRWMRTCALLTGAILLSPGPSSAQEAPPARAGEEAETPAGPAPAPAGEAGALPPTAGEAPPSEEALLEKAALEEAAIEEREIVVRPTGGAGPRLPSNRARSEVSRSDLETRLPRSAPDALRFEPGVFVQQTAHGQGSAFIRGLTGQQTLLLFDGIRLNNSTYRQGPNQYFFTLDSQTIQSIQVIRGGASTRYGSDALGGVILARPIEAVLDRPFEPHLRIRGSTPDDERGGRIQTQAALGPVGFFGGVGGRMAGELESGGIVHNPQGGGVPLVPRFERDNRTQMGTGFKELTADGRLIYRLAPGHTLKAATYLYRQFDSPRTDQCPAAYAPHDECLSYDNQFRTLVYGVYEGRAGESFFKSIRATLSYQQQFERRTLTRPAAQVENIGRDGVDTFGLSAHARSELALQNGVELALDTGLDTYVDQVRSAAWISFRDTGITQQSSRGQYLDDSSYLTGGSFAELSAHLFARRLTLRGGGRLSWIAARAPGDPDSGSSAVDRSWVPLVGNGAIEWKATERLALLFNADRSYRAPNLDDLTSRQQTGPGFQFENAGLVPEKATTLEVGVRYANSILAELWAFRTVIQDALLRSPRNDEDCPPSTPSCQASWNKFQLVNASDGSEVRGVEASLLVLLPRGLEARTSMSYTYGEGPNLGDPPSDPSIPFPARVPLSRIPPLNGSLELLWRHPSGLSLSGAMRWATLQDRLAISDQTDARIPLGGTPGYVVVDARASFRAGDLLLVSLALENLFDEAYRYHGSSVNGPGRGLTLLIDLGPLWRW